MNGQSLALYDLGARNPTWIQVPETVSIENGCED